MKRYSRIFFQSYLYGGAQGDPWRAEARDAAWEPLVDVYEQSSAIIVVLELPGIEKDQFDVTVERNMLHVRGFRQTVVPADTRHVYQMEIPYGPFARSLELPADAAVDQIEAEYKQGYLTIRVPRTRS